MVLEIKVKFIPIVGESVTLCLIHVKKQLSGTGVGITVEVVSSKDSPPATIVCGGESVESLQTKMIAFPSKGIVLTALYLTGVGVGPVSGMS